MKTDKIKLNLYTIFVYLIQLTNKIKKKYGLPLLTSVALNKK